MDKKHVKKIKRAAKKKKEKKLAQERDQKLRNQMNMFDQLPENCSVCKSDFPKTREAHMTWRVTVRNEEQLVRLFCPDCQELASKVAEEQNDV